MELKKYQQDVLADIDRFNEYLEKANDIRLAFRKYWEDRGVSLLENDDYLHEYVNSIPGVPRITLKIPTGGGKTFLACNAIKNIFDSFNSDSPKVVAWFVPSDPILTQTYRRLSDATDPYRQRIDSLFNGKVRVYDKEILLNGSNFNPVVIKEQLSILVLSIQSFASNSKEGRRVYRENENLTDFASTYTEKTMMVSGADKTALIQAISSLNPVVIIDESHNFTADLRVETLKELNPRYILELTATPKRESNIISFVDAIQLKRENMVKLPVIVYNHSTTEDVIMGAVNLQRNLESQAIEAEKNNGDYIRPIVLFQAQPKKGEDVESFEKIKKNLIEIGIPESHIKIKTAEKDELKNIDLLSRNCAVRFIITVDALKEGWDCPFAYILASLANKTSKIAVEQILGRILRQPYTRQQPNELLNLSYVFTSSADFQGTLSAIVKSLNNSGFSARDYFAVDTAVEVPVNPTTQNTIKFPTVFNFEQSETQEEFHKDGFEDFNAVDLQNLKASYNANKQSLDQSTEIVVQTAMAQSSEYNSTLVKTEDTSSTPTDLMDRVSSYGMKEVFADIARLISLPRFFIRATQNVFFENKVVEIPLSSSHLMSGFDLEKQDKIISFAETQTEAVTIDLEERSQNEFVPKYRSLNDNQRRNFSAYFQSLNEDGKSKQLAIQIAGMLQSKFDYIGSQAIIRYVENVLSGLEAYKIQELANNLLSTKKAFESKIEALAYDYKKQQFRLMLDTDKIVCKDGFHFPDKITPKDWPYGLSKSLYKEENHVDDFEKRVITQIANLENVMFWHRNFERGAGFCINGFLNHYPDFIVVLKSGKILIIETKGDHLDGSDSADKILLGTTWANKAGNNYRYYMVFDTKRVDNALTLPDLLNTISQME